MLEIQMGSVDAFKHYQNAFSLSFLLNNKKGHTKCSKLVAKEDSELRKKISYPFHFDILLTQKNFHWLQLMKEMQ